MKTVLVRYISEPEGWSAETPHRPQWSAWGETLDEVRELAREGLPLVFDQPVTMFEKVATTGAVTLATSIAISGADASGPPKALTADTEPVPVR